jgi:hypothetical protein
VVVDQSEVVLVPGRDDEHDHLVRAHQADLVDRRVRSGASVSAWSRTASATIGADVVQASAYRVVPSAA